MLIFSPLFLWALFLLAGSQTNAQSCPALGKEQNPIFDSLCKAAHARGLCNLPDVKEDCPRTCAPPGEVVECPPPWSCVSDKCLQVITSNGGRIWPSARAVCVQLATDADADLAVIPNNITDLQTLGNFIRAQSPTNTRFWLGGSDYYKTGAWNWINGKTIVDYASDNAFARPSECIYIDIEDNADKLKNVGCYASLDSVCEKKH